MEVIVTADCWAYGESAEAGNEPKIKAGAQGVEVGPRGEISTYVEIDGTIHKVLVEFVAAV